MKGNFLLYIDSRLAYFPNLKCRCFLLLGQDHFLPPPSTRLASSYTTSGPLASSSCATSSGQPASSSGTNPSDSSDVIIPGRRQAGLLLRSDQLLPAGLLLWSGHLGRTAYFSSGTAYGRRCQR